MVFNDLAHLSEPVFGVVRFKKKAVTGLIDLRVTVRFGRSGNTGKAAVSGNGGPRHPKGIAAGATDALAPGGKGVFDGGTNRIAVGVFVVAQVLFNKLIQTNRNKTGHRHSFRYVLTVCIGPIRFQGAGSNRFAFLHAFGTTGFCRQVLAAIACAIKYIATATIPKLTFDIDWVSWI